MKRNLTDIVSDTYINPSGYTLYVVLNDAIIKNEYLELSFKNSTPLSSSFFNSSLGELIDRHGLDKVKQHIKLTGLSKTQFELVKKYIAACGERVGE